MSVLQYLKIAAAAPAPAAPVPPPNPVNAPTVVAGGGRGRFVNVPRVAASKPTGQSAEYSATPLQPAASPLGQQPVVHGGMLLSPEEASAQQQVEAESQAQGVKDAPSQPKQDTILTKELLHGWKKRLSKASSEFDAPLQTYPRGTSQWDPYAKGYIPGGFPSFSSYNPFPKGGWLHGGYGIAKNILLGNLLNVKPKRWAERTILQSPESRYSQALARRLADPIQTEQQNPLLALGANMAGSLLGGKAPDAGQIESLFSNVRGNF